jgi:recombinase
MLISDPMSDLFGYKDLAGCRYPRDDEVETVRWIFWCLVYDGWSVEKIAEVLDRERSCGRTWDPPAVRRILWRMEYIRGEGDQWPDGTRILQQKVFMKAQTILRERASAFQN